MVLDNKLFWVDEEKFSDKFPDIRQTLDPDGLLAIGGELTPERLLEAYQQGIFPWYSQDQPVMWWSPDPRCILFPEDLTISRSLRRALRNDDYIINVNHAFADVINACAEPRAKSDGTWITPAIIKNYQLLHQSEYAHSIECRYRGKLVGGLYGVAIGRIFFGESMFSRMVDTSKICLVHLIKLMQEKQYVLIDCQVYSPHLQSLGATLISRDKFSDYLHKYCDINNKIPWPQISNHKF